MNKTLLSTFVATSLLVISPTSTYASPQVDTQTATVENLASLSKKGLGFSSFIGEDGKSYMTYTGSRGGDYC